MNGRRRSKAILSTGHIPAGMELFAAGDESQMEVIRRWIRESDVFLLILGGRYGSIEPKTGRSYVELEHQYAAELSKPMFALVIHEDALEQHVKSRGSKALEAEHPKELKTFREQVLTKHVRFWTDLKDIKLSIHETLSDFSRREELVGWVRGDTPSNAVTLAAEVARLVEENERLRSQVTLNPSTENYSGLDFDQLLHALSTTLVTIKDEASRGYLASYFTDKGESDDISLLSALMTVRFPLGDGLHYSSGGALREILQRSIILGLVTTEERVMGVSGAESRYTFYLLTSDGRRFLNRYETRLR